MSGPLFEDLPENERARVYAMLKRAMLNATHLGPTFAAALNTFAAALNTLTREAGDDAIPAFKGGAVRVYPDTVPTGDPAAAYRVGYRHGSNDGHADGAEWMRRQLACALYWEAGIWLAEYEAWHKRAGVSERPLAVGREPSKVAAFWRIRIHPAPCATGRAMTDYTSEKRLAELERLADAATGETWESGTTSARGYDVVPTGGAREDVVAFCRFLAFDGDLEWCADADHIAANDPAQVRALVAEIRRLRGLLRPFPPACDDLDTRITEAINKRRGEVERRKMVDQ